MCSLLLSCSRVRQKVFIQCTTGRSASPGVTPIQAMVCVSRVTVRDILFPSAVGMSIAKAIPRGLQARRGHNTCSLRISQSMFGKKSPAHVAFRPSLPEQSVEQLLSTVANASESTRHRYVTHRSYRTGLREKAQGWPGYKFLHRHGCYRAGFDGGLYISKMACYRK